MEYLQVEIPILLTIGAKIVCAISAIGIFIVSFFHAHEARKMEKRLELKLPPVLKTLLSAHVAFSVMFIGLAVLITLFYKY